MTMDGAGNFYLQLNTKTGATYSRNNGLSGTSSVEDYGDWWRVVMSAANDGTSTILRLKILPAVSTSLGDTVSPSVTGSIGFYGAQTELNASFPTSYIKTTGATATRSADVASIPVADFGYNQSEGSVVVEFQVDRDVDVGGTGIFMLTESQGSTAEVTRLYLRSIATLGYTNRTNGANDVDMTISGGAVNPNELTKVGVAYKENDFAAVRGGGTMTTDQTGSPATHKYLELRNAEYLNGHIKSIKYYPRRLTDAQLQEITS
jgi:hypothetical protein